METVNFNQVKTDIHRALISRLDLEKLSRISEDRARQAVGGMVQDIIAEGRTPFNATEKEKLQSALMDEVFGLGPLEPVLHDPEISDILVNNRNDVFIERRGLLEKLDISFRDDAHLMQIIDRIVSAVGRRIDESNPMVDARLADGSRVNAIIPPLALDGPALSIRRFGKGPLEEADLLKFRSLSPEMMELLAAAVKARISILISGGTGSGKTTLLNALSKNIPDGERIITIEDAAELQLMHHNLVRLETRIANVEGKGAVRQRQLVINSLRMRPDRIIVGEVRGDEAFDMLQAMNTGHEGSMCTIHANSPRDALARLESMVAMTNMNFPEKSIRQQIAAAITIVVQLSRLSDGTRKVLNISEITGLDENIINMHEIFTFQKKGIAPNGHVVGTFQPSRIRPRFMEQLQIAGIPLRNDLFERATEVTP
jgi:pilus assembly protein CpaF